MISEAEVCALARGSDDSAGGRLAHFEKIPKVSEIDRAIVRPLVMPLRMPLIVDERDRSGGLMIEGSRCHDLVTEWATRRTWTLASIWRGLFTQRCMQAFAGKGKPAKAIGDLKRSSVPTRLFN